MLVAAILFPSQMKMVQNEIDRVIGRGRRPTFQDQSALPYVNAWIKELERWRPVVPLAVPHSVIRDDNFEENQIPKGATVYANI